MWFRHPIYRAHSSSEDMYKRSSCCETQFDDLRRRTVILGLKNQLGHELGRPGHPGQSEERNKGAKAGLRPTRF